MAPIVDWPGENAITRLVANASENDALRCNPAEILPQSVRERLAAIWCDGGSDDRGGWDGYVMRYELIGAPPHADMQRAKAIVDEASRPASKEFVLRELARLRVSTIKGREPAEDFEWTLAVFTDELRVYPADAVREALRARSRAEKLWPTLAELIERLDRLMKPRRALREALARGYRKPEPKPPPPSEQDIPEVRDLLVANGLSTPRGPRERPLEHTWPTRAQRAAVDEETAHRRVTRIVDVSDDDPRLQAWLKEMGASTRSAAE